MRKLLALAFLFSATLLFISCGEDEPDPEMAAEPTVSTPAASSVQVGGTVEISFPFTAEGGFASSTATASGGTATITTDGTAGATSGTIVVSFVAGTTAGAGSVLLTVTDAEGQSENATAILNISASSVPSISGIPATATVEQGQMLEVNGVELGAEDGFDKFELAVDGGAATDLGLVTAGETSATVNISYDISGLTVGNHTLVFTLSDADGDVVSITHVLTVAAFPFVEEFNDIEGDVTWTADKIHILAGRITVLDGGTLTIEAGTIIKGQPGSGTNATALLVARGGKLMAMGTATAPIIFTSQSDEIIPGQIASPNLSPDQDGLWGGVIVLGKAKISAGGDVEALQIEGIPPSDTNGLYGGTDDADNSGVIKYISIRHGGANIGEGNEINGLTLGGVGTGTVIENVEIIANQDDGIEPFGGSVDVTNLLVWNAFDDSFDCDQSYSGTIDNFIGILGADSDHGMELDGPEGSFEASYTLTNGSVKGYPGASGGEYVDLRDGVLCTISNVYFFNFDATSDFEFDNNEVAQRYLDGDIALSNLQFNTSHLSTGNLTVAQIFQEKTGTGETALGIFTTLPLAASIGVVTTPTVGADKSAFAGWTWADADGQLADF